jgi:hypothetical protein
MSKFQKSKWLTKKRVQLLAKSIIRNNYEMGSVYREVGKKLRIQAESVEKAWHRNMKSVFSNFQTTHKKIAFEEEVKPGLYKKVVVWI